MSYNINEELKKEEEKFGFNKESGGWFKITEGDNRVRVCSRFAVIPEHFKQGTCYGLENGCKVRDDKGNHPEPSVKFLTHIVDRRDGQVKLAKFPYSIKQAVGNFQTEPDYEFEDMPMPYDINIKAKNAGKKEVEYTVIAGVKRTPLSQEEQIALDKQKNPQEIVEAFKEKQMKKDGTSSEVVTERDAYYPENPHKEEDIPF